jgi:hypothetical protein
VLELEPLLIDRLRSVLPPEVHVLTAAELASVAEDKQRTPAVHVVYDGFDVIQEGSGGLAVEIEQRWLTVISVRNMGAYRSGALVREDAGPILTAVFERLTGWPPGGEMERLRPARPPNAAYSQGFGYFPLLWRYRIFLNGRPQEVIPDPVALPPDPGDPLEE